MKLWLLLNSITIIATIAGIVWTRHDLRRQKERMEDRSIFDIRKASAEPTMPRMTDHSLLVSVLDAKKIYCMDYNKENKVYCEHRKNHKWRSLWAGQEYKHKTHQNGDVKWAVVKKEKADDN